MKIVWQTLTAVIFVIMLIAMQSAYWIDPIALSDIITMRDSIMRIVHDMPVVTAFAYITLYTLSIIFGIPISTTIIGGYLFGIPLGTVYSCIAIILGVTILCSLTRFVLTDWLQKRYKKQLEPFNQEIKKYGLYYVLMIHMIPFMPSFLPHIATALSSIKLYKIIGINILGALPLTIVYTVAGRYIHELDSLQAFTLYVSIFGSLLALPGAAVILYRYVAHTYNT